MIHPSATLDDEDLSIEGQPLEESELADGPEILTPDGIDEGELLDALFRDLRRGEHAKSVLVEAQMRRVIEASQSLGEGRFIDGMGQVQARVPPAVFHHWGQRYGYEIWNDPGDLIAFLDRLNPGFRVKSRGKTQVVVDGLRAGTAAGAPSSSGPNGAGAGVHKESGTAAGVGPAAVSTPGRRGGRWARR